LPWWWALVVVVVVVVVTCPQSLDDGRRGLGQASHPVPSVPSSILKFMAPWQENAKVISLAEKLENIPATLGRWTAMTSPP
jgi:hypothetical protein